VILRVRDQSLKFPRRPLVMGIVNLSADSFSGDGFADVDAALAHAREQVADGADIIDVGAESARTNRGPISAEAEAERLLAFLDGWKNVVGKSDSALLSLNTWRSEVVRKVLPHGGDILNDIGGLATDENARLCAECGAALVIMHTVGQPKVPHTHVAYDDVMQRIGAFFDERINGAVAAGIPREALILDPGIDFAKQRDDNLRIYRELAALQRFERPLLVPVSRKTVIGDVLGVPAPERDAGTVACIVAAQLRGAQIVRVHNVRAAAQAVRMVEAIESGV
jgi:dihydropteroate synthase